MALAVLEQSDFSGGIWRDTAAPANTVYDVVDGFVDGTDLVKRGATSQLLAPTAGGAAVTAVGSFTTVAGERTLVGAADGTLWLINGADTGSSQIASNLIPYSRLIAAGNFVVARTTDGSLFLYAGSRKTLTASMGTWSRSAGSDRFTGSGQSWLSTADAGMLINAFGVGGLAGWGVIRVVETDNAVTSTRVMPSSGSDSTSVFAPFGSTKVPTKTGTSVLLQAAAFAGGRLLAFRENRMHASGQQQPYFDESDYVLFPASRVIGAQGVQNDVLVFTTGGVFRVSNLAYDLTDDFGNVNWTVSNLSQEIILWGDNGLAGIGPQVIVPALDGIYLMSADGSANPIGRGIRDLYRSYVQAGYMPGVAAIYQGHYLLPILNGATVIDTLVCKLDGLAWSRWSTPVTSFAVRQPSSQGVPPKLLAGSGTDLLDASGALRPTAGNRFAGAMSVTTRDFQGRTQGRNLFKYARVRYELSDPAGAVSAGTEYATGPQGSSFASAASNDGSAPGVSDGSDAVEWVIGQRAQTLRLRVTLSGQATRSSVRSLQVFVRGSNKR